MKSCILVIILSLIFFPKYAHSEIINKHTSNDLMEMFLEDVLSLSSPGLRITLQNSYNILKQTANIKEINQGNSTVGPLSRKEFIDYYSKINTSSSDDIAGEMGNCIIDIIKIAYSPKGEDPFNSELKRNISGLMVNNYNLETIVRYTGYRNYKLNDILNYLYKAREIDNLNSKYPVLVMITTDILAAIWQKNGGKTEVIVSTFVRAPKTMMLESPELTASRNYMPFGLTLEEYIKKNPSGSKKRLTEDYMDILAVKSGISNKIKDRTIERKLEDLSDSQAQIQRQLQIQENNRRMQDLSSGFDDMRRHEMEDKIDRIDRKLRYGF